MRFSCWISCGKTEAEELVEDLKVTEGRLARKFLSRRNVASGFRHLRRFEKLSKFLVTRLVACD